MKIPFSINVSIELSHDPVWDIVGDDCPEGMLQTRIKCHCGWRGKFPEMAIDESPEGDDKFHCPKCYGIYTWEYI